MITKPDVSTQNKDLSAALVRGQVVQHLLGSTPAMQAAGELYVPRGEMERPETYRRRIENSVLLNGYKRTVKYLSGQVFTKDVSFVNAEGDVEVDAVFEAMSEDVNLQGDNLSTWTKDFFEDALNCGAALVLVEYPRVETRRRGEVLEYLDPEDQTWKAKTKEADEKNAWRPYFVHLPLNSLLGWRFEVISGRRVLTMLRFKEKVLMERGIFDSQDIEVEQIRVLTPGHFQVYRKDAARKDAGWIMDHEGSTSLPAIPVAVFMPGEKLAGFAAVPALEDLAYLNRRHWQATTEQSDLMGWVRRPAWFGKLLFDDDAQVAFGPGRLIHSRNSEADLKSVGVDHGSVEAGRQELKDLEERMALYGLQLLMPTSGGVTATERALDSAESDSTLKNWALALKDCLEQAFVFAAMWLDVPVDRAPSLMINTEFHPLMNVDPGVLLDAADRGILPKRLVFNELKRRGILPDNADWAEAKTEIEDDQRLVSGPTLDPNLARSILGSGPGVQAK